MKRSKVRVCESHGLEFRFWQELARPEKPLAGLGKVAEVASVAGEVEGNDGVFREAVGEG